MIVNYQYQALPTTAQKLELNEWLRIARYWYNRQIGDRFDWWENNRSRVDACPLVCTIPLLRDKPSYYRQKKLLPGLKKHPVHVQLVADFDRRWPTILNNRFSVEFG